MIRPTMPYGAECWPIKKQYMHKMSDVEMRMQRSICGKTRKDRIRKEFFQEHLEVAPIDYKSRAFEMLWTCPTQANNNAIEKKSFLIRATG